MTVACDPARTAVVLAGPYNDFFAADGAIYPRLRGVADQALTTAAVAGALRS